MMKRLLIVLLIGKCLCGPDLINLDLNYGANRSKFIELDLVYRGVNFKKITPIPGFEIASVLYTNLMIYNKEIHGEKVICAYVFYNQYNDNIPIFTLKGDSILKTKFLITERSTDEQEDIHCITELMKFVRVLVPHPEIQEKLKDIEKEDPPDKTISRAIYRVYHAGQYVGGSDYIRYGSVLTDEEQKSRCSDCKYRKRKRDEAFEDSDDEEERPGTSTQ